MKQFSHFHKIIFRVGFTIGINVSALFSCTKIRFLLYTDYKNSNMNESKMEIFGK